MAGVDDCATATFPIESTRRPPKSHVRQVLEDASRDLENAHFWLGFIVNPVKEHILKPALKVATHVLPSATKAVPFADEATAMGLIVPFNAFRFVYSLINREECEHRVDRVMQDCKRSFNQFTDVSNIQDILDSEAKASLIPLKGFLVSSTIELLSDPNSRLSEWKEATQRLASYCKAVGLGDELARAIVTPRFYQNIRIIGHVMSVADNVFNRRCKTALKSCQLHATSRDVAKLMRYSCAAYGREMMEAAELVSPRSSEDDSGKRSNSLVGSEALKCLVAEHVGIPPEWIKFFAMGHGGTMKLLRHYISVDHDLKAVVFVIRGTYSYSGWTIDFQGQGMPFCGGTAHKGMADVADALMRSSKDEILKHMNANPKYMLIITGQSLGSGAATLFNLLCHQDGEMSKREIRCHAFGGPPVFYHETDSPSVSKAMDDCVCYVHREDAVPYLSVHSVRRLLGKLEAVDNVTRNMSFIDVELIALGRKIPNQEIVEAAVSGDDNVREIPGGPNLIIPASVVVWFLEAEEMREVSVIPRINAMCCNPRQFASLGVLVSKDGLSDHVPPKYEQVLNKAEKYGWEILTAADA